MEIENVRTPCLLVSSFADCWYQGGLLAIIHEIMVEEVYDGF